MYEKETNLATTITDAINGSFNHKAFCNRMSREHRTLQAEFTELCLEWFTKLSEMYKDDNYDGRNKYACQTGNTIMQMLDNLGKNYRVDCYCGKTVETTYHSTLWQANNHAYNARLYDDAEKAVVMRRSNENKYDVMEKV